MAANFYKKMPLITSLQINSSSFKTKRGDKRLPVYEILTLQAA